MAIMNRYVGLEALETNENSYSVELITSRGKPVKELIA